MFVHLIQYNCWLYFILGILSYVSSMYGLFFHCILIKLKFVLIFFVNDIYMVTEICLCTLYGMLPGCAKYWESYHAYFLDMICFSIFAILVDLHSQ